MKETFKCEYKVCQYNKRKDIKHFAGIFLNGKLYCLECAVKLKLIYVDYEKPKIRFKLT